MDKLPGGKYRTNIYIRESSKEIDEELHVLYRDYAKIICENLIPAVMAAVERLDKSKIYIPDDDMNLLRWAAVSLAVGKSEVEEYAERIIEKFTVKRKDGGSYIATADVEKDYELSFDSSLYETCGDMNCTSVKYNVKSWQFNTYYDSRKGNWRDNPFTDYDYLYEHITKKIAKDDASLEKYRRLYEKGYLLSGEKDTVNMIVTTIPKKEFMASLPEYNEELLSCLNGFNRKYYELTKNTVAEHMLPLHKSACRFMHADNMMRTTVLELLIEQGALKLPGENRKHSLNTIMFCDTLPQ